VAKQDALGGQLYFLWCLELALSIFDVYLHIG
jgi:hypothetical protein